jgi:hypothetical protein
VEVLLGGVRIGLHGEVSRLPVGRADLAVLVDELEGLNQADDLVDVAADGKIVDGDLAEDAYKKEITAYSVIIYSCK